ncbi:amidohydrolase [Clostridium sp. OS1-26]|uniref:amidohydrolase n=1 Tax=Clostridium sp. OS1-26 TaxID=3070681 RepID=UPI0027DF7BB3|nr:amidohydrolase [Clostridium sp. OS1-26]WML34032.1 amidohydrolase [Clostridium sp. OS1-26]
MLLIKNGTVLTISGESIENGEVLIKNNKIVKVGVNLKVPSDCSIYDAKGGYIMPGIIDAHCHIGICEDCMGFEGDDVNEMREVVGPEYRAIDAINPMDFSFKEAYENGVTTVCTGPGSANVIGGQFAVIKTKGKRIDKMIVKAPVAMKVAFGENPKRCHNEKNEVPTTRMTTAAILRDWLFRAKYYMESKENAVKEGKAPNFDMKLEALLPLLKGEIVMKAHAHRADDIFTSIRIAKEFNLKLTLDHCTEGHLIADELSEEGYSAIVGPTLGCRPKIELKELTFDTPVVLHSSGVKIALMTDHPVIPVHYLPLCAALAVRAGLPEEAALKAITLNPAEILGIEDRVGSLEEGKDADIVVFDKHPFDIQTKSQLVLIDGEVAYKR